MKKEIIALSVILLIIIVGSFLFYQPKKGVQVELVPDRSTYNNKPTGCKAFYLLLQKMGHDTTRWQFPIQKLDLSTATKTLLIMIDPQLIGGSGCEGRTCSFSKEVENILSWLKEGGNLLIIDDSNNELLRALGIEVVKTQEIWEAEDQTLYPILPTAYVRKVEKIMIMATAHVTDNIPYGAIVHLQGKNGPVLISQQVGKGKATVLTAPYIASNRGIAKEDNIHLLMNIICKEGNNRKIFFDEYHHGYDSSLSLFGHYRGTPVAGIFLQILLIAIVLFYSVGQRFGKPHPLQKQGSRSALEYVRSMASLYYKANLQSLALRYVYLRYKNLWIKRFGLSPNIDLEELCSFISIRVNLEQERFLAILLKCEKISKKEMKLKEGEFLSLISDLENYRRRIYGQD
ncbi:MAG: DUF4350 domain-containing protein [Deltaproteobacteria bacterium]|nr:DUF4350 domain-containing protein [Deltaproteobacteria bacterium]